MNVYIASCEDKGGIYRYNLRENGSLEFIDKTELDRPMYMATHKNKLYVLLREPFEGTKDSGIVSFDIEYDGSLKNMTPVKSTKGEVACHLTADDSIYCVNYISGSIIKMPDMLVTHNGKSINPTRQSSAHTHQVIITPDNKYICVTDLGMDKILIYDKNMGLVSKACVPAGHGARHMVFSPNGEYAFCANELKSTVTAFKYCDGRLTAEETYSTLLNDSRGENAVAAIRISPDGNYLYVSNRGNDTIACFNVRGGKLFFNCTVSCGGKSPRDFNLTPNGDFIICANQDSDNITIFKVVKGMPLKIDYEVNLKSPICVIFY